MATVLYVNLQSVTNGDGSSLTPYNYTQFIQSISGGVPATQSNPDLGNRDYYLSGTKVISSDDETWEFSGLSDIINIYSVSGYNSPIKITFTSGVSFKNVDVGSVTFNNLMIQCQNQNFNLIGNNKLFIFKNCWVYAETNNIVHENATNSNIQFINSNLKANYLLLSNGYLSAINSIFAVENISTTLTSDNITIDNSVFTKDLTAYNAYSNMSIGSFYENWTESSALSADISAINQNDVDYLSATWNEISSTGNSTYTDLFWGESARDGVGALYFPYLHLVTSASSTSGNIPLTVNISATFSGTNTSTSLYDYNFGDGTTSAGVSSTYLEHIYTSVDIYSPSITAYSKNSWYSVNDSIDVSAYDAVLSGAIVTLDTATSATITSAYINNSIAVSSTFISGSPTTYDVDWGDGTSSSDVSYVDRVYSEHTYSNGGSYVIIVTLTNDASQSTELSANTLDIEEVSTRILYVDINRSYDSTATHTGTTVDPLDYGELVDMTTSGGIGVNYDTYKLKGFREISSTSEIINTNYLAGYTIDAWDLSAYGPWMIVKDDNYLENETMSFMGSSAIGGLYYNKPRVEDLVDYGSAIKISNLKNMFIVNQGLNSDIESYIYETQISAVSAVLSASGTSADPATYAYINDNFDTSSYDSWWSSQLELSSTISAYAPTSSDYGVLFYNVSAFLTMTPHNISANHILVEYGEQLGPNNLGPNISFKIYVTDCNSSYVGIRYNETTGDVDLISGTNHTGPGSDVLVESDAAALPFTAYAFLYGRIEILSGVASASYSLTSGATWVPYSNTVPLSSCSYSVSGEGSSKGLLSFINISAIGVDKDESGLPYDDAVSGTSAVYTSAYYLTSGTGNINIIGCTIYTDTGFETGRVYSASSLSSMSGSFNIEDSVIVGLEALNDTSAVTINMYNNTFNRAQTAIASDFNVSADSNNQYSWTPPTNYPFVRSAGSSYGYDQNLTWLSANPSIIAPFSGITTPPNPGYNSPEYPGYETGLFGYSRPDYIRPD